MINKNKYQSQDLAIRGGKPARAQMDSTVYPGGMLIGSEEERAVVEVIRSKRLFRYYGPDSGSSKAEQLEVAFARYAGAKHVLAVTSCTAALVCGLQGVGVGPGDEVIVPAYTWVASAAAVLAVGAVPVVAEVDDSLTLDPLDVENRITLNTKAILAVHMRGVPVQMDRILAIAEHHALKVIEDVAQANGGSFQGKKLGTLGDVGCFSLQFNKIITSGEGGLVVTNQYPVWQRAIMLHDPVAGMRNGFPEDEILWGVNYRMAELTAAVALVQLQRLDGLLACLRARKQMLVAGLTPYLADKGLAFQRLPDPTGDNAIALILLAKDRPQALRLSQALKAENINASVIYHPEVVDYHIYTHWAPIVNHRSWNECDEPWRSAHQIPAYGPEVCPRSLDLLGRTLHLTINPHCTNQDFEETLEGFAKVISLLA
jgi:8-amino-3,8-dideoxy-alpha-D-manno-octulosonate transaminase